MNEPNQGGDPIQAIRNADAAGEEQIAAVATALTGQAEPAPAPAPAPPPLPNAKRFDGYTQGLAGTLLAEDDKLKRGRADLDQQMSDAGSEQDAAIASAKRTYDMAIGDAAALYLAKKAELDEKIDDNARAVGAITAAINSLT